VLVDAFSKKLPSATKPTQAIADKAKKQKKKKKEKGCQLHILL